MAKSDDKWLFYRVLLYSLAAKKFFFRLATVLQLMPRKLSPAEKVEHDKWLADLLDFANSVERGTQPLGRWQKFYDRIFGIQEQDISVVLPYILPDIEKIPLSDTIAVGAKIDTVPKEAKEIEIVTDYSSRLGYEISKKSWPYFILAWAIAYWAASKIAAYRFFTRKNIPALRSIIPHLSFWFDHSDQLKAIRKGAASWRALDILYNFPSKYRGSLNGFAKKESDYWIGGACNSQAIRNRLKLAKDEIKKAIRGFLNEPEVRIFSIASGSAQAVVESLQELSREISFDFKVLLLDVDQTAIDASKTLVERAGMLDKFTFLKASTKSVEAVMNQFRPHIVEMVGFLDYRPRDKAISLVGRIRKLMPTGGIFLTCNIRNNPERPLVDYCLMWPMIYRDPHEFAEIITEAGFNPQSVRIVYEPFEIHGLAICRA